MYLNTNYWTDTRPKPIAHITRSKNRLKSYNDTFYLKDGCNFEIELYNPPQGRVLAKISINGVQVSAGGIIVNPGQRVFLERFIDEDRKLEFSTYWVGKTDQDRDAIEHNGRVDVSFCQEVGSPSWGPYWGSTGNPVFGPVFGNFINGNTVIPATHTNWFNTSHLTTSTNSSWILNDTSNASPKRTETGRVEKGEKSDQVLETAHGKFYEQAFAAYRFNLMPESHKTVEAGEIRNYCPGCGTRIKKSSWLFCPSCGQKLD
jgi:hypothetical protein